MSSSLRPSETQTGRCRADREFRSGMYEIGSGTECYGERTHDSSVDGGRVYGGIYVSGFLTNRDSENLVGNRGSELSTGTVRGRVCYDVSTWFTVHSSYDRTVRGRACYRAAPASSPSTLFTTVRGRVCYDESVRSITLTMSFTFVLPLSEMTARRTRESSRMCR